MFLRLDPQSPNLPELGVIVPAKHKTAMSKVPPPGTGEPNAVSGAEDDESQRWRERNRQIPSPAHLASSAWIDWVRPG